MLSVLIPIYNQDVTKLVAQLVRQLLELKIEYEIVLIDDASREDIRLKNKVLAQYQNIVFLELEQNIGRSRIRNKLAEIAQFPHLIFLDCDSELCCNLFITKYLQAIDGFSIVYGGTTYPAPETLTKTQMLHYYYGIKREALPVNMRIKNSHISFKTNNFMIPKVVFNQIKFDENIKGYGHEDTLFAIELFENNIPVVHIDNPVVHNGVETNEEFLRKISVSVTNLKIIYEISNKKELLVRFIKLIRIYKILDSLYIKLIMRVILYPIYKFSKKLLQKGTSNMKLLDFYKLFTILKKN